MKENRTNVALFKFADVWGGGEIYTKKLCEELPHHGFHVTLVTNFQGFKNLNTNKIYYFERAPDIKNKMSAAINFLRFPIDFCRYILLAKKLQKNNVKIAMLQDLNEKLILPPIFYRYGIKTVFIEHTSWEPSLVEHPLFFILKKNCRFISKIIVPSHYLFRQIKKSGSFASKVIVINHGTNKKIPFYASKKTRLVTVARLSPEKNLENAIVAMKHISNHTKLIIIGDGTEKKYLLDLTRKLGVDKKVSFLGYKEKPYDYISKNDIYISTSSIENFPISILEALSAGLPIIAPKIGGIPDIIKDKENGFLYTQNNNIELVKKIDELLSNSTLLASMRRNNVNLFRKKYSAEKMLRNTVNVLKKL
ncbi:MAG: glycosyltransferase family 4 protein [Patescibacteria group bacterium]|jgi:glycosyltransferase involved in cell wall biosynthesis